MPRDNGTNCVDSIARGIARNSSVGPPGDSAYDVAVANGFVGTEAEWLASLEGPQGDQGDPGNDGNDGNDGADGNTVLTVNGVDPDAGDGVDGDYAIRIDSGVPTYIFGPKSGGSWPPGTLLQGPQGIPGPPADFEPTELVNGGQVSWTGTGFEYRVSAADYYIEGVAISSVEQTITLDAADGSNPRIDVIALDVNGDVQKITGTASAAPSEPSVDPSEYLYLVFVNVPAGATEPPAEAPNEIVYEENDGVDEWTGAVLSGAAITFNSTDNPRTGSKCIRATNATNTSAIRFNKGSTISRDSLLELVMFIRSDQSSWGTGRIRVHLQNASGQRVGQIRDIRSGEYGFNTTNVTSYQQVSIPLADLNIPAGTPIQYVHFTTSGASISFHMDDVYFTPTGSTGNPGNPDALLRANNLSDVVNAVTSRTNLDIRDYLIVACSDETTELEAGTALRTFRMPFTGTILDVSASVNEAPTGSGITVDIKKNGTTIMSATKITIDAAEETSETATSEAITTAGFTKDDEFTIDTTAVGSTTGGKGLKVVFVLRRTAN